MVGLLFCFWTVSLPAQDKSWQKEWSEILAAAKKEGAVIVASSPDPVMRTEVLPKFTARFGIPVEFRAGRGNENLARLRAERQAGIFSVDVLMHGIDTTVSLYAQKLIDPLKPLLILPEVVDSSRWKRGKPWFIDPEEKYALRVFSTVNNILHLNTDHANPDELRSAKDLLNPKWRAKIAAEDPTVTGSGSNLASRFYLEFGAEFLRKLYIDQKPALTRNRRQLTDWLARGTYPICLNCREDDLAVLRKEGFRILEVFELSDMQPELSAGRWNLTVANKAPHPNAARLFANWIVSREGLETDSRGYGSATLRADVDESFLKPETIPRAGVKYFDNADWKWTAGGRSEARERVWKILKSQAQ